MRIALLHGCSLSELKNKFSESEYLLWAAYLIMQNEESGSQEDAEPILQDDDEIERILRQS